jgi:chemotaxis protein histidine kinase CheA
MQDATPLPQSDIDLAEAELQTELRGMFELDTQTYLQTYEQVTEQISPGTWTEDIQELYRSIHTIKGGAVTVGAEAVLATTTALEEMLSDLRYLQTAPQLADGVLSSILVEAGEVVSGSLLILQDDEAGQTALASALGRLQSLHGQVKAGFLTEIDEHQQICQDFANQGFDLMVLDLEMGLEQLPEGSQVPSSLVNTAAQVFTDLEAVGRDLGMNGGWALLVQPLLELLIESDREIWRSRSQAYLPLLKMCALDGGNLTEAGKMQLQSDGYAFEPAVETQTDASLFEAEEEEFTLFDPEALIGFTSVSEDPEMPSLISMEDDGHYSLFLEGLESESVDRTPDESESFDLGWLTDIADSTAPDLPAFAETVSLELEISDAIEDDAVIIEPTPTEIASEIPFEGFLGEGDCLPILESEGIFEEPRFFDTTDLEKESQLLDDVLKQMETSQWAAQSDEFSPINAKVTVPDNFLESLVIQPEGASEALDDAEPEWVIDIPEPASVAPKAIAKEPTQSAKIPKIPVPLDRLDRSASALVEILLSVRSTQGRYQSLQNQVAKMVALSQQCSAYITQLRQMQDDYALLQNLSHQSTDHHGLQVEGYRNGYLAINRLLENNLRLSELGGEMATNAQITKQEFSKLNQTIKVLQNSVEESRLISFKSVAFRLRAVVQDLINRMGKPVHFVIEGESQSLDAGTIQALEPALLHLLRNAYDHGLESVEDRSKTTKPREATIKLSLKQQGSAYHLALADDGKGMDRQKIALIAESKGLPLRQTETNDNLLQVICQPGFSSQSEVSAFSGRGVGMDVVKHQIQQLGGTFQLETTLGEGTRFEFKIPVPHLLVPCIVVKAGTYLFAIPTESVQTMRLWDHSCNSRNNEDLNRLLFPWEREFEGRIEPMMPVIQYWQEQGNAPEGDLAQMYTSICLRTLVNGTGSEAIWFVIDDLVEELDLLINKLPAPLKMPVGLMGMSTLPTGDMIPVLEASTIAQILMKPNATAILDANLGLTGGMGHTQTKEVNSNLILVVDDAALLRRRLEMSLSNYGYEVQCCRDGLDAWDWLQDNPNPGLMITDIEMPQMDGFTLVDRCRQAGFAFPILVSSSRLSEEWGKEAQRVGANDYLTKGFSTNELIDRVSSLMAVPVF